MGERDSSSSLRIPLGILALGAGIVAVASLSSLVVIAAIDDVDVLSTVALSLAILAFVVQIMIFLAQTWAAAQQRAQNEELNAETRVVLSKVEESVRGTQAAITDQFDRVLGVALQRTAAETQAVGYQAEFDPVEFQARLLDNVREVMQETAARERLPSRRATEPDEDRQPFRKRMQTFPPAADIPRRLAVLEALSPFALVRLTTYARKLFSWSPPRFGPGLFVPESRSFADEELASKGLLRFVDPPSDISVPGGFRAYGELTEEGIEAGRLLTALGPLPVNDPGAGNSP